MSNTASTTVADDTLHGHWRARHVPPRLDIVDAQIHLDVTPEMAIVAMNALGIQAMLVDEFWGYDEARQGFPGYRLPNGAFRPTYPLAELASLRHPDRFAYLARVVRHDPQVREVIALAGSNPHVKALRTSLHGPDAVKAFADGEHDPIFQAAQRHALPIFLNLRAAPDTPAVPLAALERYATKFDGLTIVVDHVGFSESREAFEGILTLARFPNVAMKWAHAPHFIYRWKEHARDPLEYPFELVFPYLRRAIAAFGAERLMWASDHNAIQTKHTWAEDLLYLLHSSQLTAAEKFHFFAGTLRTLLKWPLEQPKGQLNLHGH